MFKKHRFVAINLSAAVAATTIGLIPASAIAQMVLEEVVVTARKREESLQEIPIAVSAFSGDTLEELGMRDISDLRKVAPNVDLYDGNGTGGAGNVFIRGVGARNTGVNYDSGVGIYVDGVYVSRPDGAVLDNVDIQSVQVLRGPQGTLFGKNTTGGAILYTTNKPEEEFSGHGEIRAGNYNQQDGKLTLNIPLVKDVLLSRISAYSTTRDGYVKSVSNGLPGMSNNDEFNNVNRYGGQAQLRWLAADDMTVDFNTGYAKTDQAARGQNCEVVEGVPGSGWQSELQNPFIIVPSTGQTIKDWCLENQALGKDKITANLAPNKYEAEVISLALTVDWDLNEDINFKSISSARYTEGGASNELDAIGIANLGRSNYGHPDAAIRETESFSQEFQFAGTAFDDQVEYVFGVFGFTEESDAGTAVSPSGPFFGTLFNPNQAFYISQTTELLSKNTSASAFSQMDWNMTDHWRLTAGIRYTWEERKLTRRFRVPDLATLASTGDAMISPLSDTFFVFPSGADTFDPSHLFVMAMDPDNPGQVDPLADQTMNTDDDDFTPMASIQYSFEDMGFINGGTAYFTVANGFLSGGITDTVDIGTRRIEEFKPEEVWNYELGLKLDAWDNRLRLNTAIFYTDYTDRQLTTVRINPDTGRIAGALINAESSSIAGIEIEAQVIPIENLQITANVTFNEGEIDDYEDERITTVSDGPLPEGCQRITVGLSEVENCPIDRSDENLPRLPDEAYFIAIQYNLDTEIGTIVPMISWSYRTSVDNCFDRASCLSGLYTVDQEDVTARLTWTSPDENLRITAYGNNLTDERYITGGTPLVDVTETAGTIYNLPRTYGIEAAYRF
jgi:iron complex outermembrane receptor protein